MTQTTGQKAGLKAQATIRANRMKEAEEKAQNCDISVNEIYVQMTLDYNADQAAQRKATMLAKKSCNSSTSSTSSTEEENLEGISKNGNKRILYSMLEIEAKSLTSPLHVISMPSVNTFFELECLPPAESYTFIEHKPEFAKKIEMNFKGVNHEVVGGYWPDNKNVRNAYPKANFIWMDLMGKFLDRQYEEVQKLMEMSFQTEMVLAITIGHRSPVGTNSPYDVSKGLKDIFDKTGWVNCRSNCFSYKNNKGITMNCLVFRLDNSSNKGKNLLQVKKQARIAEIESSVAELQNELAELKNELADSFGLSERQLRSKKAWATRRQRWGATGCRPGKKLGRPCKNS